MKIKFFYVSKAEFKYDVLGRRLSKTTYNDEDEVKKIVGYVYSNQDAIEETSYGSSDGKEKLKDTKEYIYGNGVDDVLVMIVGTTDGKRKVENRYFYQKDQLGSITAITDDKGKVIKEYAYDEFGKVYERKENGEHWGKYNKSDIGNTRLFTGREYDKEIGLYYYRARYYSADLGRFISRDPIGTRDNVNLYSYVGNNPVGYIDSIGKEKAAIAQIFNNASLDMMQAMRFLDVPFVNNDYELALNEYFLLTETSLSSRSNLDSNFGKYDLIYGGRGGLGRDLKKDNNNNIVVNGNILPLGEVSNVLVGLNSFRLGFSQQHLEGMAMLATEAGLSNGVDGEYADRVLYTVGYEIGKLEKAGLLTDEILFQKLKQASDTRNLYLKLSI